MLLEIYYSYNTKWTIVDYVYALELFWHGHEINNLESWEIGQLMGGN